MFSAATILAKDPKTGEAVPWNPSPQRYIDGSVDNDLPMTRLAELFNVNHFIVSQVNPHVVPFLLKEEHHIAEEAQQAPSNFTTGSSLLHSLTHLARDEALYRMHMMAEIGIFSNTLTKTISVLSQKYSGDITIFPEISYKDFPRMLSNPTPEFMRQAMLCGERATWPKLSRVRNHCAIELALDEAVQKLRARVVFSPSQVDLRLGAHSRSKSDVKRRTRQVNVERKRPFSQSSAPEVSPVDSNRHLSINEATASQMSRSTNALLARTEPATAITPREFLEVNATPLDGLKGFSDLTSSGADTSNVTSRSTSSSSFSAPSPLESPSSLSTSQATGPEKR